LANLVSLKPALLTNVGAVVKRADWVARRARLLDAKGCGTFV
jgi:hypothetical protein